MVKKNIRRYRWVLFTLISFGYSYALQQDKPSIEFLNKIHIIEQLDALAELYTVYEEWPTLYKANTCEDDRKHFLKFAHHENWLVLVARNHENKLIGCITGLPLDECDTRYKEAFPNKKFPAKTFNIKDCLVSKDYRNRGVATSLYGELEKYLKAQGYENISLALTHRGETFHKQKPQNALPPHALWKKLGFHKVEPGRYYTVWTLVGEIKPFENEKQFWIKRL